MTIVELKSAAYDTLAQIEQLQMQLRQINQEIAKVQTEVIETNIAKAAVEGTVEDKPKE